MRDGKIMAVGYDEEVKDLLATDGEWLDLNGRCVVPGLVDAHVHFEGFSLSRQRVDLDGAATLDEVLQRVADYATQVESVPDLSEGEPWLQGRGWSQDAWQEPVFPTAAQLDQVVPYMPACLRHKSGHAAWVNSKALQLAGITDATPDPVGGQIQRDASAWPTGILFEDAMSLVTDRLPEPTLEQLSSAMQDAQSYCWQAGLTGLHDFDGRSCFEALQILRSQGELGLRVVKNIPVTRLEHAIGVGLRSGFGDEWLRIGGVKMFADGALGARTATMVEPYENDPQNRGIIVTDKEEMMAFAAKASANGLSVTIHAIGDRANHDVLDVYEAVREEEFGQNQRGLLRHRIEHVQLLHPSDLHRLAQLNVIASMQPIHATSDMDIADSYWGARTRYSYAWRTMLESGATLVFGSDAPVERIDPLPGVHAALTRQRSDGSPTAEGWHPEQKLTIHETIHAFTKAAAITSGQETELGSVTPGKLADLTIFDRNIFALSGKELLDVEIAGTIVGGVFRHRTW
jgi:predicted amidohydrolase YtcJ